MLSLLGMGNRRASAIPPPASRPTHAQPMGHASDAEIEAGRPQLLTLDGWMNKEGEVFKSWKRRYFKLQGTCLPYYTESGDLKGFIQLENAIVRDSLRKGMELGFEIVCNPSQATRDGGLVIAPSGEASYATAAHSPAHGSGSSPSSAPAVGTAASPAERVYYLCVEPTTPPTLAQQQRKEWMQTIANNVSYESRLHAWVSEREGRHSSAVEQLQAQVEAVRAEREMERFAAASAARERESALREEMEQARQEGHARTLSRLPVELAASISLNAEEGEGSGDGDAQGDGSAPRPPLSPRIKPQTLLDRPAALALAVDAAQSAQREADATLIGGNGLDVPSAIAALKRKNQSLEADVRMILAENAQLKSQAAQALDEARKALAEEKAAVQARRQEVEAECARARAQVAEAQEAVARANAQAEAAAAQAAAATATAAAATAAAAAASASPSAADSSADPAQGPVVDVSAATMLSPSADSILAQMATPRSATPALAGAGSSASAAYFAQASSPAPPSPRAAGGAASPAPTATSAAAAAGPMAGLSLNPPSPATQVSSRRNSFSAGASVAATLASPTGMGGPDSSAPPARAKSPESCLCACAPPCVPWDAHKKTLVALNSLENKQAALALEKGLVESQVAKYKVEKKVLKQEVIRLRQAIQQGAATPAPVAAAANNA